MKIVVTGSHFTPAQAVIEKLQKLEDVEIIYFGRKYARDDDKAPSAESKVLPKLGIKFIPIIAGKFNRFFSIQTILSLFKTPIGFIQSFYYLLKIQPDLILSFGGFTGMPVVVSGWFLSIPSIIHEQGLRMGLANSISSVFADKIAVSFDEFKAPSFVNPGKIEVTGNPIRSEILESAKPSKEIKHFIEGNEPEGSFRAKNKNRNLVLITAGNQGSHKINLIVEDKISELLKTTAVIHQTGDSKYDDYSNLTKFHSKDYFVTKWIDVSDFSFILDHADLAVSRAGINTLIELAIKKVPALMIPIPVGSEQRDNARFFAKLGLGEKLNDDDLTPEVFLRKITEMLKKKKGLKETAAGVKKLVVMGAEERIIQMVLLTLNERAHMDVNINAK